MDEVKSNEGGEKNERMYWKYLDLNQRNPNRPQDDEEWEGRIKT